MHGSGTDPLVPYRTFSSSCQSRLLLPRCYFGTEEGLGPRDTKGPETLSFRAF